MPRPGIEYTAQRAEWFNLPPKAAEESEGQFRERVSGALRKMGKTIEAHEALNNCLFDDPEYGDDVGAGLMGAIAQQMRGREYSLPPGGGGDGVAQVGDDVAVGMIVRHKLAHPREDEAMLLMALLMRGERNH